MAPKNGHVFWLFGLSGAGKSTLAAALVDKLRTEHLPVLVLDGDDLRTGLCRGLGFSDQDRTENLRRAAEVTRLGVNSGLCVVASFITPLESQRRLIREVIGPKRTTLIFVDAPLEICRQRDVKGLYARAQAGQIQQMTGIASAFERPVSTDSTISTATDSPRLSAHTLIAFALSRIRSR